MGTGGRGDDDGIGRVERGLDAGAGAGDPADLGRHLGGASRVRVGDDDLVDPQGGREEARVEVPDASGAEHRHPHRLASEPARRRAPASTRRPMAALSEGGPQQLSCSTMSQPS